jgi:mono/diheme cytochrome c family protein
MWTNEDRSTPRKRYAWMSVGILGGFLLLGCGNGGSAPENDSAQSAPSVPKAAAPPAPATVADLFPEGAGRSLVLESCGSCHAVACAVIGQRTAARWDNLKADHRDKVPNLSDQDGETVFGYLKEHFNDSQPEPKVSPDLLVGGCTPF